MLKIFSSFWTSMIRRSHSLFWFKFGSKALLNKLRKLRQWTWARCYEEDYEAFEVDWGSWTHWSWHQGVWGTNEKRAATTSQGVMGMFACYDENLKEKKRYLCRQISVLILSSSSGDSGIATCVAAHWRWWSRESSVFLETGLLPKLSVRVI
jgi:hypothetical protein